MIQYLHLPTKYKVLQPTFPMLGAIIKWRSTRSYSQHTSWTAVLPRGFHCNIVQLLSELEHRLDTSQAGTDSEKGLHLFWLYDGNSLRNKPQAEVLWNSVLGLSTNRWGLKSSGCTAVKKKNEDAPAAWSNLNFQVWDLGQESLQCLSWHTWRL